MPFKPTKEQILQAWDDLDAGKPISKEMRVYLEELEELEQENAAAAKDTSEWAKREQRANDMVRVWSELYEKAKNHPIPDDAREELRRDLRKTF